MSAILGLTSCVCFWFCLGSYLVWLEARVCVEICHPLHAQLFFWGPVQYTQGLLLQAELQNKSDHQDGTQANQNYQAAFSQHHETDLLCAAAVAKQS